VWQLRNSLLDFVKYGRYCGISMANPLKKPRFDPQPRALSGKTLDSSPGLVRLRDAERLQSHRASAEATPHLDEYFNSLFTALGPQHWWPGETPFEVIVGAILTQNTSWKNVEQAIANLRTEGLLSVAGVEQVNPRHLAKLLRPSGYFRQKARKLKAFAAFLRKEYDGSLRRMFATPTLQLREKLLGVWGIGPETADSILLYAGGRPVFVVDAYTKRMLARHGWIADKAKYEDVRWMFERQFPGDARRFNEMHALIVHTGKTWCRPQEPSCGACPLGRYLEEGR
jgi:endonuclease III related protein